MILHRRLAVDGTIYFGSWDGNFYALKPDGSKKWVFATSNIVVSSPAIGTDGTIYFGSHDKKFYALKAGRQASVVVSDRRPDHLLAGHWRRRHDLFHFDGRQPLCLAPGRLGTVAVAYRRREPSLHPCWTKAATFICQSTQSEFPSAATERDCANTITTRSWFTFLRLLPRTERFIFPHRGQGLLPFKSDGTELWHVETAGTVTTSPAIGSDGTIYVADGHFLHAINSTNGLAPPAKSSWPMFRANARHTGRVQKRLDRFRNHRVFPDTGGPVTAARAR